MKSTLGLLLILAAPSAASPQQRAPDSTITRLAWGTVNVLVRADTTHGVHVWAQTSLAAHRQRDLGFGAYFDPEAVDRWVSQANLVITAASPPPDSAIALETRPLASHDGSRVVLIRKRNKERWDKHTAILLVDREERTPWYIDVKLEEARQFIAALFDQTSHSRLHPDSVPADEHFVLDRGQCARALAGNPFPRYPYMLLRDRQSGEVWTSFVVRTDGTPDMETFRVLLSDAPAFSDAVLQAVGASHYRPAQVRNTNVAMRVYQRFTFRVGSGP